MLIVSTHIPKQYMHKKENMLSLHSFPVISFTVTPNPKEKSQKTNKHHHKKEKKNKKNQQE